MTLVEKLKLTIEQLKKHEITFALAGGLVASLYRAEARATGDIDFAILTSDEKIVEAILKNLNLNSSVLRKAHLEGGPMFAIKKQNTPVYILCGRGKTPEDVGVDFILSTVPWVERALQRAQANQIDFGFGQVPCLTLEDLIISKCYSVKNQPTRFMDLDDLRSIFESKNNIDWVYVEDRMKYLNLKIPDALKAFLPK